MTVLLIAMGGALIISFLCSLTEAALYSIPLSYIELLAQEKKKSGILLKKLRHNMQPPIAAILILNTIANTAGATISGAAAISVFGNKWLGVFSAFFTFCVLTFSEILPKTIGVIFNKQIAPIVAFPLQLIIWILSPVIYLYNFLTRLFNTKSDSTQITADEIRAAAIISRNAGGIDPEQELVIRNILDLKNKTSWDMMTPRTVMYTLNADLTIGLAWKQFGPWTFSRVPVYKKDKENIVGLVLRREALSEIANGHKNKRLSQIMKPVHFVPNTARADKLLQEFINKRQHLFVVVDEYGQIDGIVTLEDVLEEIVGKEIIDEFDTTVNMQQLARQRRRQAQEQKLSS